MADNDSETDEARALRPLQAGACIYRIAFGPRAGRKVRDVAGRNAESDGVRPDAVRRHRRIQPARGRALQYAAIAGPGDLIRVALTEGTLGG